MGQTTFDIVILNIINIVQMYEFPFGKMRLSKV